MCACLLFFKTYVSMRFFFFFPLDLLFRFLLFLHMFYVTVCLFVFRCSEIALFFELDSLFLFVGVDIGNV